MLPSTPTPKTLLPTPPPTTRVYNPPRVIRRATCDSPRPCAPQPFAARSCPAVHVTSTPLLACSVPRVLSPRQPEAAISRHLACMIADVRLWCTLPEILGVHAVADLPRQPCPFRTALPYPCPNLPRACARGRGWGRLGEGGKVREGGVTLDCHGGSAGGFCREGCISTAAARLRRRRRFTADASTLLCARQRAPAVPLAPSAPQCALSLPLFSLRRAFCPLR
eukprot:5586885-Pleurochrysis_carterae.AAC.1